VLLNNAEEETMSEGYSSGVGEGAASFLDTVAVKDKKDVMLLEGISHKRPKIEVLHLHGVTGSAGTHELGSMAGDTMR